MIGVLQLTESSMLRLTLLLCAVMIGALMILGEDRGQMRPGLAEAVAKQQAPVVAVDEPAPVLAAQPPEPAPRAAVEAVASAEPAPAPEPYVEPARKVVEDPVFTLSALGNELVPGEAGTALDTAATDLPEVSEPADSMIWYVNANSVNVRAEPSTEAEVVGKLTTGEAALVVAPVDGDWARIVIQGDGVEGYVALRYLSPEAP
jgi:Bacterial SH3 domain